jgi:hypothetical protein
MSNLYTGQEIPIYSLDMATREKILEQLKALAADKKRRARSVRLPLALDREVEQLQKQTGADYTEALVVLLEAGLEVLRGKKPGKD